MAGLSITLSLRKDEQEAIKKIMATSGLARHHVIKLALRRFLFPYEKKTPLNGVSAEITHPTFSKESGLSTLNQTKRIRITEDVEDDNVLKKESERKRILKKLSKKDRKELEDLGVDVG